MNSSAPMSIESLDREHRDAFIHAITNVLATDRAQETIAQIMDGLPTIDIVLDRHGPGNAKDKTHPIRQHTELCAGSWDKARDALSRLDPMALQFDPQLLQSFQDASPGSRQYGIRLIEMAARAIHQFAAALHQLPHDQKAHQGDIDSVVNWENHITGYRDEDDGRWIEVMRLPPKPSLFFHCFYTEFENYPSGKADVTGYWAEDRIFGGIVLFDRGESGADARDVYIHPGSRNETKRIWLLLRLQRESLVSFLLSDEPDREKLNAASPLPMICHEKSTMRFDQWDAMALHNIYRDPWERTVPEEKDFEAVRYNTFDYPEEEFLFHRAGIAPSYDVAARPGGDPSDPDALRFAEREKTEDEKRRAEEVKNTPHIPGLAWGTTLDMWDAGDWTRFKEKEAEAERKEKKQQEERYAKLRQEAADRGELELFDARARHEEETSKWVRGDRADTPRLEDFGLVSSDRPEPSENCTQRPAGEGGKKSEVEDSAVDGDPGLAASSRKRTRLSPAGDDDVKEPQIKDSVVANSTTVEPE